METGGSNVQFGINPANGDIVVIEMNPRVSRSSALASKATGFPIAKIAAKLAVGYTLDELRNDITRETVASFEPAIDYCVVKISRFTFEKFPGAKDELTTSMTYPLVGNYGICPTDMESARVHCSAFLVKECCKQPSNWQSVMLSHTSKAT